MKTERIYLLPEKGNFYKVNLHTHSKLSDGSFTPEELKAMYSAEGYSAVALTDHRRMIPHTDLSDGRFIAFTTTRNGRRQLYMMRQARQSWSLRTVQTCVWL